MICLYKADHSIIPNRTPLRFPNEVNSKSALAVVYGVYFSSPPSFGGKALARILTGLVCARIETYRQALEKTDVSSETAQQLRLYITVLEAVLTDLSAFDDLFVAELGKRAPRPDARIILDPSIIEVEPEQQKREAPRKRKLEELPARDDEEDDASSDSEYFSTDFCASDDEDLRAQPSTKRPRFSTPAESLPVASAAPVSQDIPAALPQHIESPLSCNRVASAPVKLLPIIEEIAVTAVPATLRRALPTEEELISPSSKEIKDLLADGIKLLDVIGSGGYSTVFRATHISSGHIIAIKRIEEWVPYGLVENEVKALRLFRTFPDKTQYFGYYRTSEGVHYIGTELMWGTLYKLLQQRAAGLKTSMSAVAYVAERISSSILDLHRLRMVHRDIKPENFLLDVKGRLRLSDFGLVKRLDNDARTKTYTGTPGFMAPEITREGVNAYDAYKADVFAFGRTMYYTCFSVDAPDSYERLLHLMNLFEADGDILKIGFASLLRQSLHPDPEVRPCLIQLMRDHADFLKMACTQQQFAAHIARAFPPEPSFLRKLITRAQELWMA